MAGGSGAARHLALGLLGLLAGLAGAHMGYPAAALLGGLLGVVGFGEVTVHGLGELAEALRLRRHAAGVVVNSLAVLPELFLAYSLALRGLEAGKPELMEVAVLSVMVSAAANLVVLAVVVYMGSGGLRVPGEARGLELPLLRATVALVAVVVAYAVVEAAYTGQTPRDPLEASLALLAFFTFYMLGVARVGREPGPRGPMARGAATLAAGLLGLVGSAEAMSQGVEGLVHGLSIGAAGLIVGVVGTSPEAALNLLAARRGRREEAGFGLVAATAATLLMVFGALGILLPLPLDRYIAYVLALLAAGLWLLQDSLETGGELDRREALLIALLAAAGLALLAKV